MKIYALILMFLFSFGLFAQDAKKDKSLDVSDPEQREVYIENEDGTMRLDETQIELWNSACEFFELALKAFDEKDYDSAVFLCEQAVKYAPDEIHEKWSLNMLNGDILRFLKRYEEARTCYFKISNDREYIGIRHAQALYKIGISYYEEEKWANAHPYFERVYVAYFKFDYYASRAYLYDAKAFMHLGKKELSLRILREYFLVTKDKESKIYKEAQNLNRYLLGV